MRLTRLMIAAAPMLFVLLWSTGFIGARFGLPYIEPLTFLGVRMVFVVLIMLLIALVVRARWPSWTEAGHSLAAGSLVLGLYLGGVFVAISQGVPAGISALIPGLQPILTSTIANRFMGERVSALQWAGLVFGLIGVVMVLHDRRISVAASTGAPATPCNILALACCSVALMYWLIRRSAATGFTSLFYLVPAVTALFAYFLFGEKLDALSLTGMGVCAVGAVLSNRGGAFKPVAKAAGAAGEA